MYDEPYLDISKYEYNFKNKFIKLNYSTIQGILVRKNFWFFLQTQGHIFFALDPMEITYTTYFCHTFSDRKIKKNLKMKRYVIFFSQFSIKRNEIRWAELMRISFFIMLSRGYNSYKWVNILTNIKISWDNIYIHITKKKVI